MEKKQLISVVKPLIAAALLFGSSGGVAWGQTSLAPNTNVYQGDYQSQGYSLSRNNNFGPGEGYLGNPYTVASDSWNSGNGIITVGGTQNVVWLKSPLPLYQKVVPTTTELRGSSCYNYATHSGNSLLIRAPGISIPDATGYVGPLPSHIQQVRMRRISKCRELLSLVSL